VSIWEINGCGRRRRFQLRILGAPRRAFCTYPDFSFHHRQAAYYGSESLVYTVVPAEGDDDYNELAWANIGEIRLWGALAFAIEEGQGFYSFHPIEAEHSGGSIWAQTLDTKVADRFARRLAGSISKQKHNLHWVRPDPNEVIALYEALLHADNLLLRGVNCYLKSHVLWRYPLFGEEVGINLYIALEAGLSVLRRRMSHAEKRDVSYQSVLDFIRRNFSYGEPLVDYWQDCRDDRNIVIHPDADLGPEVMHPKHADDIWELFDPMLSLYRYILIGKFRPSNLA
jgi:hypothetical protein